MLKGEGGKRRGDKVLIQERKINVKEKKKLIGKGKRKTCENER